jgi:hypothetical protein
MNRYIKIHWGRRLGAALILSAVVGSAAAGAAPIVGNGGSLMIGPYDTDYNSALDAGVTTSFGDPATGLQGNWSLQFTTMDGAFDHKFSGDTTGWTWLRNAVETTGAPVYAQWTRPTSFQVGTILYDVIKFNYPDVAGTANYTVKVASGNPGLTSTAWSSIAGGSGSASVAGTGPIGIATLPAAVDANTLRMEFSSTTYRILIDPNSHAFIDEVTVLPERYARLTITGVTVSGAPSFPKERAVDLDSQTRWFDQTAGDEFIQVSFGSSTNVDALVVYTYPGFPSDFTVTDDANNVLATVSGVSGGGFGEVIPIRFDMPSMTSSLRITFTTSQVDGVGGLAELIPLQLVPEPSTSLLLGLGGLLVWRKFNRPPRTE